MQKRFEIKKSSWYYIAITLSTYQKECIIDSNIKEINSYEAIEIKRELNQRQTLQNDYDMNTITEFY